MSRIFAERHPPGRIDLEALEMALRAALPQVGTSALRALLQYPEADPEHRQRPCPCGPSASSQGLRSLTVVTALGPVELRRPYDRGADGGQGPFPVDDELDVSPTQKSPGIRRMLAAVGHDAPFERASQQMKLLAGVEITAQEVERTAEAIGEDIGGREQPEVQQALQRDLPGAGGEAIPLLYAQMDGTAVPVGKKETVGRQGKRAGPPAHTREAKLGWVFTQTSGDEAGYPLRDPDSTTYTGALETAEQFGKRLYREAWKRGWSRAQKPVVMSDGAEWIWNIAAEHFPGAVQIVDLDPARQHLGELARPLYPHQEVKQKRWIMLQQHKLDEGRIEKLVHVLRSTDTSHPERAEKVQTEAEYFEKKPNACGTRSFAASTCASVLELSKPVAKP